ncbi:TolC family protein [Pseudoflavitalea rhizosphaerae]|uniref:TolC family protein n=1 Tax=Pseudoflavitalea rhizosphaerae TaxID=1884793 RepID=UPI0019D30D8E|nr:TolC family protein [Pseudoflavitalea rhizosphaerae]
MNMKPKMLHFRRAAFVLLILTGFAPVLQAQSASQLPSPFTLKNALEFALEHKSNVKKAKLDEENSGHQIAEVRSRALPTVTGSGSLSYNPILQLSAVPGELAGQPGTTLLIPFGQKWSSSAAISLQQNLFDQSVFTGLKAAKTTQEYYKILSTLTDEQTIEQVASNYYQVLVQRQKLVVIDSNIATTTRVKEVIEGQYKNGLAKKIDLDRTRVNISNLQAQRQQILNAVQIQENTLKFYMGMNIATPIDIPAATFENIEPSFQLAASNPDVTKLTDYQLLKKQEVLLNFQKDAVKAEYYPTLSLNGNYGYQGLGNKFPIGTGKPAVNWFDYASIGLNLKIPIFNGFATRSRVRQADVDIRKVQEDLKNTELSLNLAFENAKTQISNSIITLNNQKENVELAQEVYDNTRNNYNQGLAPLTDLLDAENSLTTAQNNYSSALLDYRLAEIQLIKSQGNLKSLLN